MSTFRPEEENSVYIGQGTELSGAIRARDNIVIDGSFEGEIVGGHLIVGSVGAVKGKIAVASADIAGHLNAEIVTKQLLVVRATGRIEGKWDCGVIEVERGAVLNGAALVAETTVMQRREALSDHAAQERQYVDFEEEEPAALLTPRREPPRLARPILRGSRRTAG